MSLTLGFSLTLAIIVALGFITAGCFAVIKHRNRKPQAINMVLFKLVIQEDCCPDVSFLEPDSGRYNDVADSTLRAKYEKEDADRLKAFHNGDWHMTFIRVRAEVYGPDDILEPGQTFDSMGCGGTESDCGEDHLRQIFEDEKAELLRTTPELRAIMAAEAARKSKGGMFTSY